MSFIALGTGAAYLSGCTKLNVTPVSTLTPANFPTTAAQFVAATGPIYTAFASGGAGRQWWLVVDLSSWRKLVRWGHLFTTQSSHLYCRQQQPRNPVAMGIRNH
jgi:hypothetical protein